MNEMIAKKVEEAINAIKKDPKLLAQFKTEPVKVIEQLLDVDLPDALVKNVIDGVMETLKNDGKADGQKDEKKDDGKLDMGDLADAAKLLKKLF